jgi:hypothetical protein
VERRQRDGHELYVQWRHGVQPAAGGVERRQRDQHELDVQWRRGVQPAVGGVERRQRDGHELYVQWRRGVQPAAGGVERRHSQRLQIVDFAMAKGNQAHVVVSLMLQNKHDILCVDVVLSTISGA